MFEQHFPYRYINHQLEKEPFEHISHNYSFRGKNDKRYIVTVEQYEENIYCAKFYLQEHKSCIHKFSRFSEQNECSRVIQTVAVILIDLLGKNPFASFLFIGANSIGEEKDNTRRYKLYKRIVEQKLSAVKFEHHFIDKYSSYIVLNKLNLGDFDILLRIEEKLKIVFED